MGTIYLGQESGGLRFWPGELGEGDRLRIAFAAPMFAGGAAHAGWEIFVSDERRRRVATVLRGPVRRSAGVMCVEWDGRDDLGERVNAGTYRVEVVHLGGGFRLERTLRIIG